MHSTHQYDKFNPIQLNMSFQIFFFFGGGLIGLIVKKEEKKSWIIFRLENFLIQKI